MYSYILIIKLSSREVCFHICNNFPSFSDCVSIFHSTFIKRITSMLAVVSLHTNNNKLFEQPNILCGLYDGKKLD